MSPYLTDYPRYAWQLMTGARSGGEWELSERRQQDIAPYLDVRRPLRILDVANGRLRPQYSILKAAGHQVYGIDFVNRSRTSKVDLAYGVARRLYIWKLGLTTERVAPHTLICGDVGVLPFPDDSFDLVISAAAFEHFLDVPAVVAELHRVLRPGGVAWISVHLFTSPSGGHNVSFTQLPLQTVPQGVEPWDHLRRRRLPFSVPLNEWRKEQYVAALAQHFEILTQYCGSREGEHLLTPEIAAELAEYSREELTCSAYVIVARKR